MFTALIHSSNPNSVVQVVIKHDGRYHARHSVANERKMMDATLGQIWMCEVRQTTQAEDIVVSRNSLPQEKEINKGKELLGTHWYHRT
jgi:hypothetical protein